MRKEFVLMGLGNTLFGDEGVGIHALRELEKICRFPNIDYIYGGTLGFGLLHVCEGRKRIIVIDGGKCGIQPGSFKRFGREEIESQKAVKRFSLHEFDLFTLFDMAERMGMLSGTEVIIYCMEIEHMEVSDSLSYSVKKGLPHLVKAVYDEVIAYMGKSVLEKVKMK